MDYKPSASLDNTCERAHIYARIRSFFSQNGVLEVETPILSHSTVTDVNLHSVIAQFHQQDKSKKGYLQTSPEFAMKRLLATWKQPIYQITKVFRDNELGKRHNIEFTMLEWYRPNGTIDELIKELNLLVNEVLKTQTMFERITYQQAFLDYAYIDPFTVTLDELEQTARFFEIDTSLYRDYTPINDMADKEQVEASKIQDPDDIDDISEADEYSLQEAQELLGITKTEESSTTNKNAQPISAYGYVLDSLGNSVESFTDTQNQCSQETLETNSGSDFESSSLKGEDCTLTEHVLETPEEKELKAEWLDLLYSHLVEPKLGTVLPTVIYDFPAEQASLAKVGIDANGNKVAKRFELYIDGLELANAYDELSDRQEQQARFEMDNVARQERGLETIPIDHHLLDALEDMPDSVGIAVGIDRLVMLATKTKDIADVVNFTTPES